MSHTTRWYNKPNGVFYFHPYYQLSMRCCCRRCMKPYISRKRRSDNKVQLRKELAAMQQAEYWLDELFNSPLRACGKDSIMPSVQRIQDAGRCCLINQRGPDEWCPKQDTIQVKLNAVTVGDLYAYICL